MKFLLLLLALVLPSRAGLTDEPVDDRRLEAELVKFAESQLNSGKTAAMDALKAQLERKSCQATVATPGNKSDTLPIAAKRVRPGVAIVGGIFKCKKCSHWHLNAASGFFISTDGILVTNHHVIATGEKDALVILTGDNRMATVTEVLASDPVADIAILRCEGSGYTALPLNADAPDGSQVGVWSHPDKRYFSLSAGIVARRFLVRNPAGSREALGITADYARGSSGGPVFDDRGNVVGMVASTDSIYYNEEKGQQKNLQMVFKNCVSARSILALIEPKPAKPLAP